MLIEAIHLASRGVRPDAADKIINVARRAYLPLYKDELAVLRPIAETQDVHQVTMEEQEYLFRFLDAGVVLCYMNDDFWYDVHPLIAPPSARHEPRGGGGAGTDPVLSGERDRVLVRDRDRG